MKRADFYIGLGDTAQWLGSIGSDGAPNTVDTNHDLFNLEANVEDYTVETYRELVDAIIGDAASAGAVTARAAAGDPWPWHYQTSAGTSYTYAWNNGCIHVFEQGYMVAQHYPNGARRPSVFPSMARKHPKNPVAGVTSPRGGG